jgi:pimeloyl-ACP methyl ester carboxylesterase
MAANSEKIKPMKIEVSQDVLDDLMDRLKHTRWPRPVPDGGGWAYGADLDYMKELIDYWITEYDWRAEEERLNKFHHFKADVNDIGVHFIHEQGKGPNPIPLLLLHGYPWSITMFEKIIPMLTDPASYGGDSADSFTVIAPSLIGFGFSDAPKEQGFQFVKQADTLRDLMVNVLGYEKFAVQGGDWGGIICTPLGYKYPENIIGLSQNYMGVTIRQECEPDPNEIRGHGMETVPLRPSTPDALKFWKIFENWCENEGGYRHIQMTRPQSLAYAMCDSPAGLAGWIVEKMRAWSDCDGDIEKVFTKDEIIANVMLYWLDSAFSSAIRIYYETKHHPWKLKPGDCVEVPTAFTAFPAEHTPIIKSRAEAYYKDIRRFTNMKHGGHFAVFEEPADLAEELRIFFRELR